MGQLPWLFLAAALVSRETAASPAADLVLRGVLRVAPRQILTTPVDLTVAGGRVVFDRAAGEAGNSR